MWFLFASRNKKHPVVAIPSMIRLLPSAEEIQRLLNRERARSDRTRSPLSVVVYSIADQPRSGALNEKHWATLAQLVAFLRGRLRTTDEVGWLDEARICAVLPDTPAPGAWRVAKESLKAVDGDHHCLNCTVFTYPDDPAVALSSEEDTAGHDEEGACQGLETLLVCPPSAGKRIFDLVLATMALVVFSPILAGIALAIWLTSGSPILFCQRRSGLGGKPFVIYKFRTMVVDAEKLKAALLAKSEQDGPAFKMRRDPRVTRIGRFLRVTSLDELPQLWNVIKGDMSIVGPRPLPCDETNRSEGWQRQRLLVTPGITCIWQVWGRSQVSFADWMRMDVRYVRSWSFWQDLKLVLHTIPAVLLRRGAC